MTFPRCFPCRLPTALLLTLLCLPAFGADRDDTDAHAQRLVHTLEYMRVDYPEAVEDGRVIDAHEYQEMQEFAANIEAAVGTLAPTAARAGLIEQAAELRALVEDKSAPEQVEALTRAMSRSLLQAYSVPGAPEQAPDLRAAAELYQALCLSCHGVSGRGDGPLAERLKPRPTDFHDGERQRGRSLQGLFNAIALGVDETAMAAYADPLSEEAIWGLAFYVGNFMFSPEQQAQGAELWARGEAGALADPARLSQATPAEIEREHGAAGLAVFAYLRSAPEVVSNE